MVLVEKDKQLGGWAAKLWKRVPFKQPYAEPQDTGLAELAAKVSSHPRITVHLNSILAETSGAPGRFSVQVAQESGSVVTEEVGAIVQATGFTAYDINKLPELGGGKSANVVDQAGLEALARTCRWRGDQTRRRQGSQQRGIHPVRRTAQRGQPEHLPYCSGHCCATSVKQAMYFKRC